MQHMSVGAALEKLAALGQYSGWGIQLGYHPAIGQVTRQSGVIQFV